MNNCENDKPQNLKESQLTGLSPESGDRFDQELAKWFALHGKVWCGTPSALIVALRNSGEITDGLWSRSSLDLYSLIESHKERFGSLGVEVVLPRGFPRMIQLRLCNDSQIPGAAGSDASGISEALVQELPADAAAAGPENATETLMALLKKADLESSNPSPRSKLAAAPGLFRSAVKKVWTKRTNAS